MSHARVRTALLLVHLCVVVGAINWNGQNWAMGCDFRDNDLKNVRVRGEDCGGECARTADCTHFAWNQYEGGTCWLKQGSVTKANAFESADSNMVCGVVDKGPSK